MKKNAWLYAKPENQTQRGNKPKNIFIPIMWRALHGDARNLKNINVIFLKIQTLVMIPITSGLLYF